MLLGVGAKVRRGSGLISGAGRIISLGVKGASNTSRLAASGRILVPSNAFAAPDIFGPYGFEDGLTDAGGLLIAGDSEITNVTTNTFTGTHAAKFHYFTNPAASGNTDSNHHVDLHTIGTGLTHFFARWYVKFDGSTMAWSSAGAVGRKFLYVKAGTSINNVTWNMVLGGFDLGILFSGNAGASNNNYPLDVDYIFPLDSYRGIEVEIQANTPNVADGLMRLWIYNPDGTTVWSQTWSGLKIRDDGFTDPIMSIEFGDQADESIDGFGIDENRWLDDIAVSSKRIGPIVGTGTSAFTPFDVGLDFRGSQGGATDPVNCVGQITDSYPTFHTVSRFVSVNEGWTGSVAGEDLSATDGILGGDCYRSHGWGAGSTTLTVRLPYPMPGTYDIRLALGGVGVTNFPNVEVRDGPGGPVLFTISDVAGCAASQFYDATGVIRTSPTDWKNNNASRSITLSSGLLILNLMYLSPLGGGGNRISHLRLTRTA